MKENQQKNGAQANTLVSLITVNWNGLEYLKMLFSSLRKVSYQPIEVILVDNASSDESVTFTREHFPEVKIVQNDKNYMYARGNNEGIKVARGEILCLINNDVKVDPGFLEPVVQTFLSDEEVVACQPKILDLQLPEQFEYAGAAGGFIDRYGYPFLRGRLFFTVEEDRGQYDADINLFWASGACLFLRRNALGQIGLLDEDFILHMEEIDLCWRIHLAGKLIRYVSESLVWHKGGGTMSADDPRKVYWNYRNNIFLLVKNLSGVNLIKVVCARFFLDFLAFAGEIARGKLRSAISILKAYIWVLLHVPLLFRKRRLVQRQRIAGDRQVFRFIYPGSIVWEYFVRGRKKFSDLKRKGFLGVNI